MVLLSLTTICIALSTPLAPANPMPHPNHVTLAEIEFNPKSKCFEVSLCVAPEDLETALAELHRKNQDSQDVAFKLDDASVKKYAGQWLTKEFALQSVSQISANVKTKAESEVSAKKQAKASAGVAASSSKIRWVGCQLEIKKAWLYFEIKPDRQAAHFKLENRLFFKSNEEQINHVKLKHGAQLEWFKTDRKQPTISIEIS